MKNIFIIILTFLSLILYGQNNMNEQLKNLFLELDLTSNPKTMANNSFLKFEYMIRQGISWGKTGGNTSNFVAKFYKNPLIASRIKEGQITIIQKDEEVQSNTFSINERICFYNEEDMINEYNKTTALFEEYGYRVKNSTVQNENFETNFEFTEILMKTNSKKSTLTISYSLPPKEENDKNYFLVFVYSNH